MNKVFNFFFRNLWILGILICFTACKKKQTHPQPIFDPNLPGSEVVDSYDEFTPHVVYYYKIDDKGNQTQEKIGEAYYYDNKQEYTGGGMKEGKKDGQWYAFFKDGSVQTEAYYVEGIEHGSYNLYRENGKPLLKGHYDHGICDGTWFYYDESGKEIKKITADKNTAACKYCAKCQRLKQK